MSDDTQPPGTQPFGTPPSPPQRPTAKPAPPAPPLRPSERHASLQELPSIAPAAPLAAPPTHQATPPSHQATPPAFPDHHPAQALVDAPTLLDGGNDALVTTTTVTRGRGLRFGLVAAVAAVSVAGAVAVNTALSAPAGPQTPEAAVDQMLAAIENEDVLGMTDVMLPSERESLIEPSLAVLDEIQRLGFLDDIDFDRDPGIEGGLISGLDVGFEGVEYVVTPIGDGVANVSVIAGTATATVDPSELPDSFDDSSMSETPFTEVDDLSDDDISMTIVEEDGGWYVSIWYSVAEQARRDAGAAVPAFGQGPAAVGGATPGEAVSGLITEMVELDLNGSIGHLDPREFRALYDYSPLFVPDAQAEIDQLRAELAQEDITWSVSDVVTSSQEIRGRTVVSVEGLSGSVSTPDGTFSLVSDGDCQTVSGPGIDTQTVCASDVTEPDADLGGLADLTLVQKLSEVETGITVVERDGRWFVSGAPTVLYGAVDVLSILDRSDIDQFEAEWERALEEYFTGFGGFGFDDFGLEGESAAVEFEAVAEAIEADQAMPAEDVVVPDAPEVVVADYFDGAEIWSQSPETWWLAWEVGDAVAPSTVVTLWGDAGWVEVAGFESADGAARTFATLERFAPGAIAGIDPPAQVYVAEGGEFVVLVDRFIVNGFDDAESAALAARQVDFVLGR